MGCLKRVNRFLKNKDSPRTRKMQRLAKWGNEVSSKAPWSDLTTIPFNSLSYCPLCESIANWLKNKTNKKTGQLTTYYLTHFMCL